MRNKKLGSAASTFLLISAVVLFASIQPAGAQTGAHVILHFQQTQGSEPLTALISDAAGNLYGTASLGGSAACDFQCGTVFELSPGSGGTWNPTVLYAFQGTNDGFRPYGTLVFDKEGNLYGVAGAGELSQTGVVFRLTKRSDGTWSEKVVYLFTKMDSVPNGDLTWDNAGNLYGTTRYGGTSHYGEVFELSPSGNGVKETVIHNFSPADGVSGPVAGVTIDNQGNLYGAVYGSSGEGAIYELASQGNGQWGLSLLWNFTGGADNGYPNSKLTLDANGNLYGTAMGASFGSVFELSQVNGKWNESTLYTFNHGGAQPLRPQGGLVFDDNGNLYGASPYGGEGCSNEWCGTVFRLNPQSGGGWNLTTLHQFQSANDGSQPQAGVLLDNAGGHLFGTTRFGGGRYGYGTVFEIGK